jgi:hypothetical protein
VEAIVINALVGAFAALGTHVLAREALRDRLRRELEVELDRDLRTERRKAYCDLWKRLEPLAIYAPKHQLDGTSLRALSAELTEWYYEVGGVYLTETAKGLYFTLQDLLQIERTGVVRAADRRFQRDPKNVRGLVALGTPPAEHDKAYFELFRAASDLRSCVARELNSRAPLIAPDE